MNLNRLKLVIKCINLQSTEITAAYWKMQTLCSKGNKCMIDNNLISLAKAKLQFSFFMEHAVPSC